MQKPYAVPGFHGRDIVVFQIVLCNVYLIFFLLFFFRAVITEEFKVPDKMVGFSKYLGCF